jgi:Holliday junction resolvasome RuvABC ATP-dependent DNA helicase subunit
VKASPYIIKVMFNKKHTLFTEKYRPDTLEGYIGNDDFKSSLQQWIDSNDIPHLLLTGGAGTGKTTAAKLIINNIDCDSLYINCSDENGNPKMVASANPGCDGSKVFIISCLVILF